MDQPAGTRAPTSAVMVRVPGQFDHQNSDLAVATPTCCCCCCCCLVTVASTVAYTMSIGIQETFKRNDPKERSLMAAGLGLGLSLAGIATTRFVEQYIDRITEGLIPPLLSFAISLGVTTFVAQLIMARWASKQERPVKTQMKESALVAWVAAGSFIGEFVTLGWALYGQFLALVVPAFVGWQRAKYGPYRPAYHVYPSSVVKDSSAVFNDSSAPRPQPANSAVPSIEAGPNHL
jgi:hypothetical protein